MLLFMPIVLAMALMRAQAEKREALTTGRGRIACYALSALALAVCLLGGQLSNYEKLVSDQLDGTQDAYIAQFEREYALCEAAGPEDDVILPAWTVQTVTGKPTAYEDATGLDERIDGAVFRREERARGGCWGRTLGRCSGKLT